MTLIFKNHPPPSPWNVKSSHVDLEVVFLRSQSPKAKRRRTGWGRQGWGLWKSEVLQGLPARIGLLWCSGVKLLEGWRPHVFIATFFFLLLLLLLLLPSSFLCVVNVLRFSTELGIQISPSVTMCPRRTTAHKPQILHRGIALTTRMRLGLVGLGAGKVSLFLRMLQMLDL